MNLIRVRYFTKAVSALFPSHQPHWALFIRHPTGLETGSHPPNFGSLRFQEETSIPDLLLQLHRGAPEPLGPRRWLRSVQSAASSSSFKWSQAGPKPCRQAPNLRSHPTAIRAPERIQHLFPPPASSLQLTTTPCSPSCRSSAGPRLKPQQPAPHQVCPKPPLALVLRGPSQNVLI